jgi:hypothetical protein
MKKDRTYYHKSVGLRFDKNKERTHCIMCGLPFSKLDPVSFEDPSWCYPCFLVGEGEMDLVDLKATRAARAGVKRPTYYKGWVHPSGKVTS